MVSKKQPRLDNSTSSILSYRPNINYVEPEATEPVIDPITLDEPNIDEVTKEIEAIKALADNVGVLATAVQAVIDARCKNVAVKLDPRVDFATIQAMRRLYPDSDPYLITYDQYRKCKENLYNAGLDIAKQTTITTDQVNKEIDRATQSATGSNSNNASGSLANFGGWGDPDAKIGGLRIGDFGKIIDGIDMEEMQFDLIKILVNYIWKEWIRPIIPFGDSLPEKICDENPVLAKSLAKSGAPVLGEENKKQEKPDIPKNANTLIP